MARVNGEILTKPPGEPPENHERIVQLEHALERANETVLSRRVALAKGQNQKKKRRDALAAVLRNAERAVANIIETLELEKTRIR